MNQKEAAPSYGVRQSSGAFKRWVVVLSLLTTSVTIYLCRTWHWTNLLCLATAYASSFCALWCMSKLIRTSEGGSSRRAATTLPTSDVGTPSTLNPQLSTSQRPSPAVARVIYINLLNTTKHRL